MKKIGSIILATALLLCFSGCGLWMNGSYRSEIPHREDSNAGTHLSTEVSSYSQLCDTLLQMISNGTQSEVIYFVNMDSNQMKFHMPRAIEEVTQKTPLGAYAVESINFESGKNTGKNAVEVSISYIHGRSEILRIRKAESADDVYKIIDSALNNCDVSATIYVNDYEAFDATQYVQDYVDLHPDICMEMPQVTATVYPENGKDRIVEVLFSYNTSRETLRQMQQTVEPIFDSAELYVRGDGDLAEKYYQLYSFLIERYDYSFETSITPSYHLLRHGVGDSKAFATVYARMCVRAGLECAVISGAKAGESSFWNAIILDDQTLYVDLLACNASGHFQTKTKEQMTGYVWDYDIDLSASEENQ